MSLKVKAVFKYVSECCNLQAFKPALVKRNPDAKDEQIGLGKWRCTGCNKLTKVSKQKLDKAA